MPLKENQNAPEKPITLSQKSSASLPPSSMMTDQQLQALAETDTQNINDAIAFALKNQEKSAERAINNGRPVYENFIGVNSLRGKAVTVEQVKQTIADPERKRQYERAHRIYDNEFYTRGYLYRQLHDKNPDAAQYELCSNDPSFIRIDEFMVDPKKSDRENLKRMRGDNGASLSMLVDDMMRTDLGALFDPDPDRFLDAMENSPNPAAIVTGLQIDTAIGQSSIYRNVAEHGHVGEPVPADLTQINYNSPMMQKYSRTHRAGGPRNTGLTAGQVDFLLENEELIMVFGDAGTRIADYTSPLHRIVPGNDRTMQTAIAEYFPHERTLDDGVLGKNAENYYQRPLGSAVNYNYVNNASQSRSENPLPLQVLDDLLKKHPEIIANGWLNADFSGAVTKKDGQSVCVTKLQALQAYDKNPKSVVFALNDFGKQRKPELDAARREVAAFTKQIEQMEKDLKNVYGSSLNASKEFNDLAKSITDLKKAAVKENQRFIPSMDHLARKLEKTQQLADKYITAKKENLKANKRGSEINKLRGQRMEFAESIKKFPDPLYVKHAKQSLQQELLEVQKHTREYIDSLNAAVPTAGTGRSVLEGATSPEKYMDLYEGNIQATMAKMVAINTCIDAVNKVEQGAKSAGVLPDRDVINGILASVGAPTKTTDTNEDALWNTAKKIKDDPAFKATVEDLKPYTYEKLAELVATPDGKAPPQNGIQNLHERYIAKILEENQKMPYDKVRDAFSKTTAEIKKDEQAREARRAAAPKPAARAKQEPEKRSGSVVAKQGNEPVAK